MANPASPQFNSTNLVSIGLGSPFSIVKKLFTPEVLIASIILVIVPLIEGRVERLLKVHPTNPIPPL
jgi:hypothetical protein